MGQYYVNVYLVQWFGLISHSPCEAINSEADFMCKGISTLLKHKHNSERNNRIIHNTIASAGIFAQGHRRKCQVQKNLSK